MRKWHTGFGKPMAILIGLLPFFGAALAQDLRPDVFLPVAASLAAGTATDAASQPVTFNASALLNLPIGAEARVALPRLGMRSIVHDRTAHHAGGGFTWVGHFKDYGTDYRAIITSGVGGGTAGHISTPAGEFSLAPGNGNAWLLDRKQAGFEGAPQSDDDGLVQPSPPLVVKARQAALLPTLAASAGPTTIDLMIVYTPGMAKRYGADLPTRLANLVEVANQAYIDSGVNIALRLVHSVEISYGDTTPVSAALDGLTNGTGAFSGIPTLRRRYGADLVQLVRPYYHSLNSCGLAWIASANPVAKYGYSVIEEGNDMEGSLFYCYDLALAHELGHNMGAAHDRAHAVGTPGAYDYSYGYGINSVFATIMAAGYISATPVAKFSNPNITCGPNSDPCGVASNLPNSADNAQTLNNTRAAIAGFTVAPVTVTLKATPTSISYRGSATLRWSSADAVSCSASTSSGWAGAAPLSGSLVVTPTASTRYSVTCIGNAGTSKTATVTVAVTVNPALKLCLFNWAETAYPALFSPAGAASQTMTPYVYRYYKKTNAYLGISSIDNHLYYLGPEGALTDVGDLSIWLAKANCL